MVSDEKPEKKNSMKDKVFDDQEGKNDLLEGKTLHDLYRHATKLIK